MKLFEIMGFPYIDSDVGIEIETEGAELPFLKGDKIWKSVEDGSLRGGLEYIFRKPLHVNKVGDSLAHLNKIFADHNVIPNFSFRTSVHVHVNCLGLEYRHILNFIYIYLLLENILVEYCGEGRKCNRFCLRLEDADGTLDTISYLFESKNGSRNIIKDLANDKVRYASMNVQALAKFGSIEFRAMRGTTDPNILVPWAETLCHIRDYSKKFETPKDVYLRVEEIGFMEFFKESVGEHHPMFNRTDVENSIAMSQSLTIELPFIESREEELFLGRPLHKEYRYEGGKYTVAFLRDHFNGRLPMDLIEAMDRQDAKEQVGARGIRNPAIPDLFEAILDEVEEEEGEEYEEDEEEDFDEED